MRVPILQVPIYINMNICIYISIYLCLYVYTIKVRNCIYFSQFKLQLIKCRIWFDMRYMNHKL